MNLLGQLGKLVFHIGVFKLLLYLLKPLNHGLQLRLSLLFLIKFGQTDVKAFVSNTCWRLVLVAELELQLLVLGIESVGLSSVVLFYGREPVRNH